MDILKQALRTALFFALAFFGLIMAMVFMASTALAICILYIVAKLQGKPFGVKAYWQEKRKATPTGPKKWAKSHKNDDVVDIEMREIN